MASSGFELGRRMEHCGLSGSLLRPGDHVVTALFEKEGDEGLERRDYLATAWDDGPRPQGVFAFWRGVVPDPSVKQRTLIDSESVMSIFESLADDDHPKRQLFRYLLALVLVRKRLLSVVDSRPGDNGRGSVMLVRLRGAAPESGAIEVIDPGVDQASVAEATEQLEAVLRSDA
jgi:hypothetical protein